MISSQTIGSVAVLAGALVGGGVFLLIAFLVGVDVLQDEALREGIKSFTDWPTIPQLYVKGEFVGGSDIIREMFQAGELQALMVEKGVPLGEA